MEGRRNHVLRQQLAQSIAQRIGIERPRAGVESDEALAAARTLADHDRALAHADQLHERALDLADLYSEAADLDLSIVPPEELQLSVGEPAAIVAAAIQFLTVAVRIGEERSLRAFGIVDIPAADAYSGEHDLARCAERDRRQALVDDVDVHVVDGPAERNGLSSRHGVHDLVVRVVGGLGEPVRIHELDAGLS